MKIIGITGTFGSGKSEAARIFADMGAYVVDHDRINHEILQKGRKGYKALIKEYGKDTLNEEGEIDRRKVAGLVFSSEESVRRIEKILHPIIIEIEKELVLQYKRERKYDYIIFDTPLLFEARRDKVCDYTVVITADEDKIYDRINKKFKLKRGEIKRRMNFQMSLTEKKHRADFVIENNGSLKELTEKIEELFSKIKGGE
jgi:dephospho-CoA kinase